jgi:hypothetical protein
LFQGINWNYTSSTNVFNQIAKGGLNENEPNGKRLKRHKDLVEQVGEQSSTNIFGLESKVAVWRKVK